MNWKDLYPYCNNDLINQPFHYHYTSFHGKSLLEAWQENRKDAGSSSHAHKPAVKISDAVSDATSSGEIQTDQLLSQLLGKLTTKQTNSDDFHLINKLVQKFEVSKKVYSAYTEKFRPAENADPWDVKNYVLLAQVFALSYEKESKLYYLNALLKILDTLTSIHKQLPSDLYKDFQDLLEKEATFVRELATKHGVAI